MFIFQMISAGFYACSHPGCGAIIKSKSDFSWHVKRHLGIFKYNCPYCSKGVSNTGMLKEHLKTHHTGLLGYHCITCKQEMRSVHELKAHLQQESCKPQN